MHLNTFQRLLHVRVINLLLIQNLRLNHDRMHDLLRCEPHVNYRIRFLRNFFKAKPIIVFESVTISSDGLQFIVPK